MSELAGNPLFGFGKEDENLNPGVPFYPLPVAAITHTEDGRPSTRRRWP